MKKMKQIDFFPYQGDEDTCECGPKGDGREEDGSICPHIQARRAVALARK